MTTPTLLPDNRPLCVVTGHPCGSDTVRVGTDCPSTSGRCVHKSQSSFTQQNMTTPTPRTDAYYASIYSDCEGIEFTRQLERDLASAQEARQRAEERAAQKEAELARFKEEREGNTRQFRRLQERLAQSEADASSLAAGQCIVTNGGLMGDDHGHLYCDMQRQRDEQRGRLRVMADIMNAALDVMKTVEGDGSDEDEALMHIRAKMASAIDSVRRADKAAIDSAREKP